MQESINYLGSERTNISKTSDLPGRKVTPLQHAEEENGGPRPTAVGCEGEDRDPWKIPGMELGGGQHKKKQDHRRRLRDPFRWNR